jgi:uncharacterized protein (DUF305 family)
MEKNMKTLNYIKIGILVLLMSTGAMAQHDGHGTTDTSAGKEISDAKSGGMKMMNKDKMFIEQMIPHHQDAVDMAQLALEKSKRDEIKKLSSEIIKAQNTEIEAMTKWYKEWYKADVPKAGMGKGGMMNKDGNTRHRQMMEMGMMNSSGGMMMNMKMDLNALKNSPDFDKSFIEMMVKHHAMAVMMSGMIIDSKRNELRKLAREISSTQATEIEQMIQLYIKWYGAWK